jgi:hypothetical protein
VRVGSDADKSVRAGLGGAGRQDDAGEQELSGPSLLLVCCSGAGWKVKRRGSRQQTGDTAG